LIPSPSKNVELPLAGHEHPALQWQEDLHRQSVQDLHSLAVHSQQHLHWQSAHLHLAQHLQTENDVSN